MKCKDVLPFICGSYETRVTQVRTKLVQDRTKVSVKHPMKSERSSEMYPATRLELQVLSATRFFTNWGNVKWQWKWRQRVAVVTPIAKKMTCFETQISIYPTSRFNSTTCFACDIFAFRVQKGSLFSLKTGARRFQDLVEI